MESYGMTMTLEDEVYEQKGREYLKHLAEAMGQTKEQIARSLFTGFETINVRFNVYIKMPRRGRYQVWHGAELVADRIKHRKQALAMAKLVEGNEQDG